MFWKRPKLVRYWQEMFDAINCNWAIGIQFSPDPLLGILGNTISVSGWKKLLNIFGCPPSHYTALLGGQGEIDTIYKKADVPLRRQSTQI